MYTNVYVSHLGEYKCDKCGQIQPKAEVYAVGAKFKEGKMSEMKIKSKGKEDLVKVNLKGRYNVYNVVAAYATGLGLGIKRETIKEGMKKFKPAFGRLEEIEYMGKRLRIMLAKNPTGLNQVLETLGEIGRKRKISLLMVLNDLIADGRDVSWIWDADFDLLKKLRIERLMVSGMRAEDLGLRIKHSQLGIRKKGFEIEKNLKK